MARGQLNFLLRRLHRLADGGARTDGQLLHDFVLRHEEAAFAEMVQRHGPMVLAVCRRLLPQDADAEDAFQATFLVLARRAPSIRQRESAAGFLYGVAWRIASRIRAQATRRPASSSVVPISREDPATEAARRELRQVLDAELSQLPEKYRTPVVLCYLEGCSHADAAGRLGWPEGTVKGRLARARDLLRGRLARRGLALSAAALAAGLSREAVAVPVPATLLTSAVHVGCLAATAQGTAALSGRVAALAEGTLRVPLSVRPQLTLVVLLLALGLAVTAGGFRARPAAADPAADPAPAAAGPVPLGATPHKDRFGDPLPAGALARLGTVRFRQGDIVGRLVFSTDGTRLGSLGWNGTFHVWDATSGKEPYRLDLAAHGFPTGSRQVQIGQTEDFVGRCQAIALPSSPRGLTLLTVGHGKLEQWDLPANSAASPAEATREGARKHTVPLPPVNWNQLALSPDGKVLAGGITGQNGQHAQLGLWELQHDVERLSLRELGRFEGASESFSSIVFSADGKTVAGLARVDQGRTEPLLLLDVVSAREIAILQVPPITANAQEAAVAVAPNGRTLALGCRDRTLRLWDFRGQEIRRLEGHEDEIAGVAFSPDGKLLVSGSRDRTVRLWDVATGKEMQCCRGHESWVEAVAFSPDGRTVASGGQDYLIRLWNVASGKELLPQAGPQHWVTCVAIAPDSKTAVTGGFDNTLRFWDLTTGQELRQLHHPRGIMAVAFSPDGKLLASSSFDRTIRLWDGATGQELRRLEGHENGVCALAFSPDGKLLVSGSDDQTVRLWDVATGQERRQLRGHTGIVRAVAFSPDGRTAVSGSYDATVRLWDVATGRQVRVCAGHSGSVHGVAFSADGRVLVSGGLAALGAFQGAGPAAGPASLADALRLWDPATGKELRSCPGEPDPQAQHQRDVAGVAISPDGRTLAAAEENGGLVLYELATGQPRRRLEGHTGKTEAVAFSADGKRLVSIGTDLTALVWDALGRPDPTPTAHLSPQQLDAHWSALAGKDAHKAWEAIVALASQEQTASFLQKHLRPVPVMEERRLARLVTDLDSDRFAVRDQARRELEKLGESAQGALRRALEGNPSVEVRRRVEELVDKLDQASPSPERLQALRALEALERLGTADAYRLLAELAGGATEAWLTREARAAVIRSERNP
jgi:RNA polymerase sigma factor (sigma-70 family)